MSSLEVITKVRGANAYGSIGKVGILSRSVQCSRFSMNWSMYVAFGKIESSVNVITCPSANRSPTVSS